MVRRTRSGGIPKVRGGKGRRRFRTCMPIGSGGNQVMTAYRMLGTIGGGIYGEGDGIHINRDGSYDI